MTISVAQFRANFPAFGSTTTYPNAMVQFWLTNAYNFLDASRWAAQLDLGAQLWTAHMISLEMISNANSDAQGTPGQNTGPVSSKSVGGASVSYDTGAAAEDKGGHWNLTTYGTRFLRIANMMGMGPIQLGIGVVDPLNGQGWSGPLTIPGFSNFM